MHLCRKVVAMWPEKDLFHLDVELVFYVVRYLLPEFGVLYPVYQYQGRLFEGSGRHEIDVYCDYYAAYCVHVWNAKVSNHDAGKTYERGRAVLYRVLGVQVERSYVVFLGDATCLKRPVERDAACGGQSHHGDL